MKILHLTDFHYSYRHEGEQNVLVDKLIEAVKKEEDIDFVFFTGDLVLKGGHNGKDFESAYREFLLKLTVECDFDSNNLFICCGNHDVVRGLETPSIKPHIDGFDKVEQLDNLINNKDKRDYNLSLDNIKPYLEFQKLFYSNFPKEDVTSDLYTIHNRDFNGKKIAIATINTAWRSFDSNKDKGILLYPLTLMNTIINQTKDSDIKILLMHHPLSDLKEYVSYELENLIFNSFDFLFSGHVHKQKLSTHISGDDGIFWCVSPAALTVYDTASTIGFNIIDIDSFDFHEAYVTKYVYQKNEQVFYKSENPLFLTIPVGALKDEALKFKKLMRSKLENLNSKADELFLSAYENGNVKRSFIELFTPPLLRNKSKADYARDKMNSAFKKSVGQSYDLDNIKFDSNNYVITGQDKSGKTSLLYKVNIDILKNFNTLKVLPYYFDCKDYKLASDNNFDWVRLFSRYFQVTQRNAENLPNKYKIKLLIDNYDINNEELNLKIYNLINYNENISFIICTLETLSINNNTLSLGKNHTTLFIHDITRTQIRGLTEKWPSIPAEKRDQAIERILAIFQQLRIPCNYWNVSLFLWIFEKTSNTNLHNNVDLIQLYIEKLLDKELLTLHSKTFRINFDELRDYLGELAYYMITNHAVHTYSTSYSELVTFTSLYKDRNIRFVIDIEDVIKFILQKGVLKKDVLTSRYTFRLNGVFEYFLAIYLRNNITYRNAAIEDDHSYLSYSNEFELYAGFNKKDTDFVYKIFTKTMSIFSSVNDKYGETLDIDNVLISQAEDLLNVKIQRLIDISEKEITSLTPEEKDKILEENMPLSIDQADVSLKKYYIDIEPNADNLEKTLKILARVFRNASLDDVKSSLLILDYILQCACQLGFVLLDEYEEKGALNIDKSELGAKKIFKLWVNFIPLIVQTFLYDSLAQDDLERLLFTKLEELSIDKDKNQYQIMLLYTLIIDLNPQKNIHLVDNAIEDINLGILRNTLLIKLYTYLAFQSHGNVSFENDLREKIRKLIIKIDPSTNRSNIERQLLHLSKISLIDTAKK